MVISVHHELLHTYSVITRPHTNHKLGKQLKVHTHLTALCPGLPGRAGTRKVKNNLDFTGARDSEWQWHQLGHMQVCTSLQSPDR